jgi:N-acyl-D-aspartate/D-glutamate deacylase
MTERGTYLLKNGLIVDGSGGEAFHGDVLVSKDKIAAVGGDLDESGLEPERVLDVGGKVIAPGFIDTHTHDDSFLLRSPDMLPKISQGVTTVVVGNCGISLSPLTRDVDPPPPLTLLGGKDDFRYTTFAEYVEAVKRVQPNTNVAALIGHSVLRVNQMDDLRRPATQEEIKQMQQQLAEGLANGAIGLSTGLSYPVAVHSSQEEIQSLTEVVKKYGGIYTTHLRNQFDGVIEATKEALKTAQFSHVPLVLSHHQCVGPLNWGKTAVTLQLVDEAIQSEDVALDCYPYIAGSTVLDPDLIVEDTAVMVTGSESHPDRHGQYLQDIAREWNCSFVEACSRLQPAGAIYFVFSEEDVQRVLKHPHTMIGSDGLPLDKHPHPRLWGTFPRVLGHYTRRLKLFTLAEAVSKMTGLPAKRFGFHKRGLVREGYYADLVVFDPKTVIDKATFEEPKQQSVGIDMVMVNGCVAFQDGHLTDTERAGRVLQRGQ